MTHLWEYTETGESWAFRGNTEAGSNPSARSVLAVQDSGITLGDFFSGKTAQLLRLGHTAVDRAVHCHAKWSISYTLNGGK